MYGVAHDDEVIHFAFRYRLYKKKCPGYDTKLHLMVRFQIWSTPSLSLLPGPLWLVLVVPISVLLISQIDLFKNYLYTIEYLISFNCMQIKFLWSYDHLLRIIIITWNI